MKKRKLLPRRGGSDKILFISICILSFLGILVLFDASAPVALSRFGDKFYFVRQQAFFFGLGFVLMLLVSRLDLSLFEKYAVPIFFINIVLLIAVLIPGLGLDILGARRRLSLGLLSFQPAELTKLTISLYIAKTASSNKPFLSYLIPLGISVGLIILEPDLGTSIIVATIAMIQIFAAGTNLFYFAGLTLTGLMSGLILILTSSYRKDRLLTYLEMSRDPLGASYHIRQVLYSLGLGGLWGVGLGRSRQKYLYLPEVATDSIFAVIAEEVGFIGSLIVIGLFGVFIFQGLKVARNAPNVFSKVLACGIVSWIGGQALLNFSAMTALLPLTGVPLPFFSYGGSSLLTIFIGLGLLLNISRQSYEHS